MLNTIYYTHMLYIVGTPIGNLGDISDRMRKTLTDVDVIIMESIADSQKLLNILGIKGKKFIKYNEKNATSAMPAILEVLKKNNAAFVTSAGMPGISDPGAGLVRAARKAGIAIAVIPGPSALASAIAASGIRAKEFTFISFPPKKAGQLKHMFEKYSMQQTVLVFFESTFRIVKTMTALYEAVPDCFVCVAKEMTKIHEAYLEGTPAEVLNCFVSDTKLEKGEFVVLVDFQ